MLKSVFLNIHGKINSYTDLFFTWDNGSIFPDKGVSSSRPSKL